MQRILSLFCVILGWLPLSGQDLHRLLLDYYNGHISLSPDSAKVVASSVQSAPQSPYYHALSSYLLGYNQDIGHDKVSALLSYLSALKGLSEIDTSDLYLEVNARKSLGFLLHGYQHYDHAIAFYQKAMPFAEQYNDQEQASLLYNTGFAYRKMDSITQARQCFETSLALSGGNTKKRLQILNQSGLLEQQIKQYEIAASFYQQMISMKASIPESLHRYLWMAHHNLGTVYLERGVFDSAIYSLNAGLPYASKANAFISYKDLGEAYLASDSKIKAFEAWARADSLYDQVSLHPDHFGVFKLMALALPQSNHKRWAYFQRYTSELESYQNQSDEIKELAARGYVGSLVSHYLDEVAEAKERQAGIWKIGMFIGGIVTTLLVLLVFQWWRKRQLTNKVGDLTGTIKDVEITLKNAIEAVK